MTALNLNVGEDSVTLLTDLGLYDLSDGTLLQVGPKAWISPTLKLAMAITGLSSVWERLQPLADGASSQSEILSGVPDVLRWLDADPRFSATDRNTRIGIAFWAEGAGPKACYAVGARGRTYADERPYELVDVKGLIQPFIEGAYQRGVALNSNSARPLASSGG